MVDGVGLDDAVGVDGEVGGFVALGFEVLAGVEDGVVFGAAGDDVVAGFLEGGGDADDGGVVGFGAAAGEYDFAGAAVEYAGDALAGFVEGVAGFLADGVDAGGVAEVLGEVGRHGLQHLGG